MTKKQTLVMDVKVGDSLTFDGGRIVLTVQEKSGQRAKLRLAMDADATVTRGSRAPSAATVAKGGVRWSPNG